MAVIRAQAETRASPLLVVLVGSSWLTDLANWQINMEKVRWRTDEKFEIDRREDAKHKK